ncbi:MAG: hypothetical protein GYB66_06640 [Chloroflexi bacterium]|nr:hypothetical protein [Chloroflexota bacterium]
MMNSSTLRNAFKLSSLLVIALIGVLAMSSAILASDLAVNSKSHAQEPSAHPSTEDALMAARVPPRDLADLAQRLQGAGELPEPPTSPVRSYQNGDVDTFWVHNDDQVMEIEATLVYMNDVVYMWVQNGYSVNEADLRTAADRFATEIYQPVRDVFGSEASPGVDGDPRLHILHSVDLGQNVAGYFYSVSQYPREAIATSNAREMFFISINMLNYGVEPYLSVLAHEFQHMIHWAVDANEENWLDEGAAELSAYVAGFGVSGFSTRFLANPNLQLNDWPSGNTGPHYGASFMFMAYLLERYGVETIQDLVANATNGMESIQQVLDSRGIVDPISGEPMTAEGLFSEWSIANYLNNSQVLDGRYGYQSPDLQRIGTATPTQRFSQSPVSLSEAMVSQWGTRYYILDRTALAPEIQLRFDGSDTVDLLPMSAYSGQYAYWSNRVNSSDTRLTREFDLSGVDAATLSYRTWYDIEDGWDYAYVMVSTDSGATWDILPTDRTTTRNPHGTAYGSGYTGASGEWVHETVDLSTYAGQTVLVRFEYITDDATLGGGMLIDDVSIPEIGYFADFEQPDASWQAEGWVLVDNVLAQRFGLHVIIYNTDGTIDVQRLHLADDRTSAKWNLPLDDEVDQIVVVVSGFAPATVQPARFDLQIEALP